MEDFMERYGKNVEKLDGFHSVFLIDFLSKEEKIEYEKLINLLYKYNELIKTLNIGVVGENVALDDIRLLRNEKAILMDREYQFMFRLQVKEAKLKEELKKIQERISTIDIYSLEEMKHLSTIILQLEEQAEKVARGKKILENIRTEKGVLLQKHNSIFSTFSLYENRLCAIQQEIETVIQQIREQSLSLQSKNKEKIVRKKGSYLEEAFAQMPKSMLRMFNHISSEIRGKVIKKYLDLVYSYSEIRHSILMQSLPIAQDIVDNYRTRPTKLERNISVDLFTYEIETQLQMVVSSIYQIALLPLKNQKLEAQKIVYDMELLMKQNDLHIQVIRGENVEEVLKKLTELYNKELGCKNIAQLYRNVSHSQNFSFWKYGSKKINESKTERKQKSYVRNGN